MKKILFIIIALLICTGALEANNVRANYIMNNFRKILLDSNYSNENIDDVIYKGQFKKNLLNYLKDKKVTDFHYNIKKINKINHNTYKIYTRCEIRYTKKGSIANYGVEFDSFFIVNNSTNKIEKSSFIQEIKKTNTLSNYLFMSMFIVLPFFGHALYKRKIKWAFLILILNIIGVIIYYFSQIKNKNKNK